VLRAYFCEHGRLFTHGPMLGPDDVLPALPPPGQPVLDAGALILTGVVRRSPQLVHVAASAFDGSGMWAFAPCPLPAEAQPAAAAEAVLLAAQRSRASARPP